MEEAHQQVHPGHAIDRRHARSRSADRDPRRIGCRGPRHQGKGRRRGEANPTSCVAGPPRPRIPFLRRCQRCHFQPPERLWPFPAAKRPERVIKSGMTRGESDKCDGISMDSLITAAARALAAGDPLAALKCVALRDDAPALALRGIAMAQLGELTRAKELLRSAVRAFGPREPVARARCVVAEAEIALVSRDLGRSVQALGAARAILEAHGDSANAAHAGYLEARQLLLIGKLDEAELTLEGLDANALPPASRVGHGLVSAGIAMRRIRTKPARTALDQAARAAREA